MKNLYPAFSLLAASGHLAYGLQLNLSSDVSIRNAAATAAYGLMSFYTANVTGSPTQIGTFISIPSWYWWIGGAAWGAMVDYWAFTGDDSYVNTTTQALLAQAGPTNDFMPPAYSSSMGNDDQGFWAVAAMSAAELGFPSAPSNVSWLDLARNAFEDMVTRWDTSSCGGGLRWQVFSSESGYDYKNTVSNGVFLQLGARLSRFTGNSTYSDWAGKIWNWTESVGLIGPNYQVFDGTSDTTNCTSVDDHQWTYNLGMYMYGAAVMYNYTNGSDIWMQRLNGTLDGMSVFFSPYRNATNIMYEVACELHNTCNTDQLSFKAYLSRWMSKTSVMAPYSASVIKTFLHASALGAAQSCSGGQSRTACGTKWYTGGWDGTNGIGPQLSALELFTGLLVRPPLNVNATNSTNI